MDYTDTKPISKPGTIIKLVVKYNMFVYHVYMHVYSLPTPQAKFLKWSNYRIAVNIRGRKLSRIHRK